MDPESALVKGQTTPYPPGTAIQCEPDSTNDDNRDDPYILTDGETYDITSHTDYGNSNYPEPGNTYNCWNRICVRKKSNFSLFSSTSFGN